MTNIRELPEILDATQVAEWLSKDQGTIRKWAKQGKIPSLKIGPYYHFHRDTLEDLFFKSSKK